VLHLIRPAGRWAAGAACVEQPEPFFSEDIAEQAKAVAVCDTCPVSGPCLRSGARRTPGGTAWRRRVRNPSRTPTGGVDGRSTRSTARRAARRADHRGRAHARDRGRARTRRARANRVPLGGQKRCGMTFVQARLDRSAALPRRRLAPVAPYGSGRLEAVEGDDQTEYRLLDGAVASTTSSSPRATATSSRSPPGVGDFETITLTPAQHRRLEPGRVPVPGRLAPAFFVHAYVQRLPAAQLRHVLVARADDVAHALTSATHLLQVATCS